MTRSIIDVHSFRRRFRKDPLFSVRLDNGDELVVHEETVVTCRLRAGMDVTDDVVEQMTTLERRIGAAEKAMRLIGVRPRSSAELREKLARDKTPMPIIEEVLAKLVSAGLVNDEDFAWRFARAILKRKRIGERLLRQQLQQKGIPQDTIAVIVRELYPETEQLKSALELAQKKKRAYRTGDEEEIRRKMTAFLLQRGFSNDVARQVVKKLAGGQEEGNDFE